MKIGMILDKEFPPDPRVENEALALVSKGIEVLNSSNSYSIKYDGADKTPEEKWLPFANKFKLFKKKD